MSIVGKTNMITTFTITTQPYYDEYYKTYKNILMINIEPPGPLKQFVKRCKMNKLSPYQINRGSNVFRQCGLAIVRGFALNSSNIYNGYPYLGENSEDFMTPDEIPDLISFLLANGYQIDTQITNMLNQSEVKFDNKKIVFTVTHYAFRQPNIVYMR
jgi:hypothetical protein